MKVAFFEVHDWERDIVSKNLKKHNLKLYSDTINDDNIDNVKDYDILSVFIYSKIDKKVLERMPNLKMVVTRSTGFDHIDLKECAKRKITVCNIPFYGENTVAEHTFALILALSRRVHQSYLRTLGNDFSIEGLKGFDLKGKTLGVIGTGHIGKHVIRIARGFEMNVIAFDKFKDNKFAKKIGFKYVGMNELIKKSDIITLHLPSTKENYHLINKKSIEGMKNGVIIINTARGELIDTVALLNYLEKGKIAGAGLDVLEGEGMIKEEKSLLHVDASQLKKVVTDHSLLRNEKVVFTPHIAFYSQEALMRIINTTIENINCFMKNKPINVVKNV